MIVLFVLLTIANMYFSFWLIDWLDDLRKKHWRILPYWFTEATQTLGMIYCLLSMCSIPIVIIIYCVRYFN